MRRDADGWQRALNGCSTGVERALEIAGAGQFARDI
jgi:hypothetical protein